MLHKIRCNYITVDYQQIGYGNIANQIHGFTTDYGKFMLNLFNSYSTMARWI